jgi:hypothetical protein
MGRRLQIIATPQAILGRQARAAETPEEKALRNLRGRCRRYGISVYDARQMMDQQAGCCAICSKAISLESAYEANIDHSHATGKVRGILCPICNKAIKYRAHLKRFDAKIGAYLGSEEE